LWHDDIARALGIPILHIADAALADAARTGPARRVGLLATSATLQARIYQSRGDALCWIEPDPAEVEACVMPGIRAVKSNRLDEGRRLLSKAAHRLLDRGADRLLLACTEIPIALADVTLPVPVIDPTLALARACVQWARAGHGGMQPA
jgi:aspartate racemase